MDLLNTVKSALGGALGGKQTDLMSLILNLIAGQSCGLNGFIQLFAAKGLGDVVQSWIGTGKNLPITPEQLQNVLGADTVKGLASKSGMDSNALLGQLSNLLPQAIDKLTPGGKIPEGDIMKQGKDLLGGLFSKK